MRTAIGFVGFFCLIPVGPAAEPDFSRSASVEISRTHQGWLNEAESHRRAGRFAEAVASLQKVLDAEPAFVSRNAVLENSHNAALRVLKELPADWQDRYAEEFGPMADRELASARQRNDLAALRRVAARYPLTRAGFEALRLSVLRQFDHGEFLAASAGFRQIGEHPFTGESSADLLRWSASLSRLGLHEEARQIVHRHPRLTAFLPETESDRSDGPALLPSRRAVWERSPTWPDAVGKLVGSMEKELARRGFLPPATGLPIVAGNLVIARSLGEISAYGLGTGALVWRKSTESQSIDLAQEGLLANPQFQAMLARRLGVFALADPSAVRLTSDGGRVFAVLKDNGPVANVAGWGFGQNELHPRRIDSQLLALEAATGKELWRLPVELPGPDPSQPDRDARSSIFFFGPPLPLGNSLYAVGQKDQVIRLYRIAAESGRVQWSLPLAAAELPVSKDDLRRRLNCRVVAAGGLLLCPTGAGALAAVDPHSRSCRWIFRYGRDDAPKPIPGLWPPAGASGAPQDRWWTGWRDVGLVVHGKTLLLASPESDQLYAISLPSGEPKWQLPRDDGLFIADAGDDVLVIGKKIIRVIDPENGEIVWKIPTPMPAGRGIVRTSEAGSTYLLPLKAGGVLEIDPVRRTTRRTFPLDPKPWGNLVAAGDAVLMQTHDRLVRLEPLNPSAPPPGDADSLLAWSKSQREAGRFREAAGGLRDRVPSPEAEEELRETLFLEMSDHPERAAEVFRELEPLLEKAEDRIRARRTLAEAEARAGRPLKSLKHWLVLLDENPVGMINCPDDPALEVEYSRYIQGAIHDLLAASEPDIKQQLKARWDDYREKTLSRRDPFAASRLARRLDQLKWGRELILKEEHRTGIGLSARERQLNLWALTEDPAQPRIQALAYRRLAEDRLAELRFREAAFFFRQLKEQFSEVKFPEGMTGREFINQLPADSPVQKYLTGNTARWPEQKPRITAERRSSRLPALISVPVQSRPGSLCSELDLWFDTQRKRLHFSGGGHSGGWELPLPEGRSALDDSLREGWGVGPMLILQQGTKLLGIAPLDDHGEPRPRILWQAELLENDGGPIVFHRYQPPAGFGHPNALFLDSYHQTIAQVGPVSAGAVIYQSAGRLVALETATGRKLWSRCELPSEAMITGDARHVLIVERAEARATILRTLDGRVVRTGNLPEGDVLTWWGSRALVRRESAEGVAFFLWNAVADRFAWEQNAPPKVLAFEVDNGRWGWITPEGELTLLDGETGRPLSVTRLESIKNPTQVHSASDESGIYLAISHPQESPDENEQLQTEDNFFPSRHFLLAGSLCGFDRRTGQNRWQTEWGQGMLPMEQPAAGPVLLLHRRVNSNAEGEYALLRCLDKRTGKAVYHLRTTETWELPRWSGNPEEGMFELEAYRSTVQFRYE